ncbi:MAG: AEC family transporter [Oscillospiraceae bacterium]|jgi:predicted permease|nr:AEC family transporter [Oscillospiraceae bacterium]
MLQNIMTVASQTGSLFLLMIVGIVLYKTKMVSDTGSQNMTNILLYAVAPCVMIHALNREFDSGVAAEIAIFAGASSLIIIICGAFAMLLFKKQSDFDRPVMRISIAMCNCGFMGIPLAKAVCGEDGVLFASVFMCVYCFFQWTYGYATVVKGKIPISKIILNPGTIGFTVGILVFVFSIPIPAPIDTAMTMLTEINSPLAMLVIGFMLAKTDVKLAIKDYRLYLVGFLRLITGPLAAVAVILLFQGVLGKTGLLVLLIEAATPVAAAVPMMAAIGKKNTELGSQIVAVSSVLSILTMPIAISLGSAMVNAL